MSPQQIDNIKIEDISKLDLESLKNEQVVVRIEEIAEDSQLENEPMYARECYDALETTLNKFRNQIIGSEIYKRLHTVEIKLFWQALPVMEKKIKEQAFTQNIIFTLKHKINVFKPLVDYFDLYEFGVGPDYEKRQGFLYSLSHNEEQLGSQLILLKTGQKVLPHIKNWLSDFMSYLSSQKIGDAYEITNYLFSSPNAKLLSKEDRDMLASILGIYNWLKHPDYIPEIEKPGQTTASRLILKPHIPVPPKPIPHGQSIDFLKNELGVVKKPSLTPQEIKREVDTLELPTPPTVGLERSREVRPIPPIRPTVGLERSREVSPIQPISLIRPISPIKPPIPIPPKPQTLPKPPTPINTLDDIKVLDDLKKIDIRHLRAGNIKNQVDLIKSKILFISQINRILPFYAVQVFEQSPLFKIYLSLGSQLIADRNADRKAAFDLASKHLEATGQGSLTLPEFEAVADLRKEIEKL